MEGRRSLCLAELIPGKGSLVMSELCICIGGSSTEDLGLRSLSESDTDSFQGPIVSLLLPMCARLCFHCV